MSDPRSDVTSASVSLSSLKGHFPAVWRVIRWQFWGVSVIPVWMGMRLAGGEASLADVLLCALIFGPCLEGGAEAINDYFDRDTDDINSVKKVAGVRLSGGTGVIQEKLMSPGAVLRLAVLLLVTGVGVSIFVGNLVFSGLALAFALIGVLYSAGPVRFKERGFLGPLVVGLSFGGISLYAGYAFITGYVDAYILWVSLPLILIISGLFITSHLADYEVDRRRGVRTTPVVHGFEQACFLSMVLCFAGILAAFSVSLQVQLNPLVAMVLVGMVCLVFSGLLKKQITNTVRVSAVLVESLVSLVYL